MEYHECLQPCILQVGDEADSLEALVPILGGKPLLAMNFHDMEVRIAPCSHTPATPAFVATTVQSRHCHEARVGTASG